MLQHTPEQLQKHIQERGYLLNYLFIAEYEDGTRFLQRQDDWSDIEEKKSQFYDMRIYESPIKSFSLVTADHIEKGHIVKVDLLDGHFEVDGLPILLESVKLPTLPEHFELIYYRQHTHDFLATYNVESKDLASVPEEQSHFIEYFIGWKANINGKEYIQKLAVA